MANNRMYLWHKPTGFAVYLGKAMGYAWYGAPEDLGKNINDLFEAVEHSGENQNAWALAMEDADGALATDRWDSCENVTALGEGNRQIVLLQLKERHE